VRSPCISGQDDEPENERSTDTGDGVQIKETGKQ